MGVQLLPIAYSPFPVLAQGLFVASPNYKCLTGHDIKPHPLRVVCLVLGFKSPLQNVITLACLLQRNYVNAQRAAKATQLLWSAKREAPLKGAALPKGARGITNYELFNILLVISKLPHPN